mmetsp:Transcript_54400/g.162029  ORF Transcript_54400/g.162029 Transcript_54400/m.162029 type:complete len:232 (-) Transcript_54400:1303-1998(-)
MHSQEHAPGNCCAWLQHGQRLQDVLEHGPLSENGEGDQKRQDDRAPREEKSRLGRPVLLQRGRHWRGRAQRSNRHGRRRPGKRLTSTGSLMENRIAPGTVINPPLELDGHLHVGELLLDVLVLSVHAQDAVTRKYARAAAGRVPAGNGALRESLQHLQLGRAVSRNRLDLHAQPVRGPCALNVHTEALRTHSAQGPPARHHELGRRLAYEAPHIQGAVHGHDAVSNLELLE